MFSQPTPTKSENQCSLFVLLGFLLIPGFVVASWFLIADSEEKKSVAVVQLFPFEFRKKSESPAKLDVHLFKRLGYLMLSPQDMYRIPIDHTESSEGYVSYFFSTSQFQIWSFRCLDSRLSWRQQWCRRTTWTKSTRTEWFKRKSQQREGTVTSGTSTKKITDKNHSSTFHFFLDLY